MQLSLDSLIELVDVASEEVPAGKVAQAMLHECMAPVASQLESACAGGFQQDYATDYAGVAHWGFKGTRYLLGLLGVQAKSKRQFINRMPAGPCADDCGMNAGTAGVAGPDMRKIEPDLARAIPNPSLFLWRVQEAEQAKEVGNACFLDGSLAETQAKYESGIKSIQIAIGHAPSSAASRHAQEVEVSLHLNLALVHLKSQKHLAAVASASAALRLRPDNVKALYRRGLGFIDLGRENWAEAFNDLERALELEPKNVQVQEAFAALARRMELDGSLDGHGIFGERAAQQRNHAYQMVAALKAEGEEAQARRLHNEAIRKYTAALDAGMPNGFGSKPSFLSAAAASLLLCARARAFADVEQYGTAMQDCETAIEMNPSCGQAFLQAARCRFALGDFRAAEEWRARGCCAAHGEEEQCELKAFALKVERCDAARCEARQFLEGARLQDAPPEEFDIVLAKLRTLEADCPKDVVVQILLARALVQKGGLQEQDYDQLRQVIPRLKAVEGGRTGSAAYWAARSLQAIGKREGARRQFYRAVEAGSAEDAVQSLDAMAKAERLKGDGNAAFTAGRFEEARQFWEEAMKASVGDAEMLAALHANVSSAWRREYNLDAAFQEAQRAVCICPSYAHGRFRRGVAHFDLGRAKDATEDFQEAQRLRPGSIPGIVDWLRRAYVAVIAGGERKWYYPVLGLLCDCTQDDIRQTYRQMARKCHPDKMYSASEEEKASAEARFKEVQEAYEVLSSVSRRRQYDFGWAF